MTKLFKEHRIFFIILLVGIFLRSYKPLAWFAYQHDQDVASWIIKDILVNKHLRLIGQETNSQGVFIGPIFYYLQIPFYLLTNMDPKGTILLPILISVFSIFSFYFVFTKMFGKKVGVIASLIYAVSAQVVFTEREVAPTMPLMLWSVWYFYTVYLLYEAPRAYARGFFSAQLHSKSCSADFKKLSSLGSRPRFSAFADKGKSKAYIFLGFLLGLIWNINFSLATLFLVAIMAQIFSRKKFELKNLALGVLVLIITLSPFIVFEFKHDFIQTKAIASSLTTDKDYIEGTSKGFAKLDRVIQIVHKNTTRLFLGNYYFLPVSWAFYILIILFGVCWQKKLAEKKLLIIMVFWQLIYLVFFTINPINISEYYLYGMNVIWIAIVSLTTSHFLSRKMLFKLVVSGAAIFTGLHLYSNFKYSSNRAGYLERYAIVKFINEDAKTHNYPCVSVSYITSPGYEFGYRYLFWLEGMHVNRPISGSPVYSIVFPHNKVNRLDKFFGALGLVLPDYGKYTSNEVLVSCSGENSNLTDPMFGYTE